MTLRSGVPVWQARARFSEAAAAHRRQPRRRPPVDSRVGVCRANYIEANEAISKKGFVVPIKICRKESKECRLFLRLIDTGTDPSVQAERGLLVQEATELASIFGAIMRKSE